MLFLWLGTALASSSVPRPHFSWDTLPVFFHSSNTSGPWSEAAVSQIARFALATNEKSHAMRLPGGGSQSEEIAGPYACRQVNNVTGGPIRNNSATRAFFYLNSVIDWPFNFKLHALMVAHPEYRLKNRTGHDIGPPGSGTSPSGSASPGGNWLYNLTNDALRAAWVDTCVEAARDGCAGCFIDQANVAEGIATWPSNSPEVAAYRLAHLAALTELDAALTPMGGFAINNHLGTRAYGTSAMMVEDFVGSEKCVATLRTLAARNFTVEAHVGNYPAGNTCQHADTNSLAAFLVGAGEFHYYHCAPTWGSDARWPAVPDDWLDWLPEYDAPLGAPLGLATQRPSRAAGAPASASLWSRSFASGTRVAFDGGSANGTIWWANGVVQAGTPTNLTSIARGCNWESMSPLFARL